MCPLALLLLIFHYCNYSFWIQLFAIIGRNGRRCPFHASGCSPLALGLDCQVSGLTSCVPSPTWMRKSSSEGTRMASAHAIIEGAGQRQRWRLAAGTSGDSPARCRRCRAGALAFAVAALVAAAGGGDQRQQFSILEHSRPASVQLLRKWTKFSWLLLGTFFKSARRPRPCFL